MFVRGLSPLSMTPAERLQGRFMRGPDHDGADDDNGVDSDDTDDQDDDQSGQSDDDAEGDDQEGETDGSEPSGDDESDGKRKPGRNGYERRIGKLTARTKQLERELQEARNAKREDTPKSENKGAVSPDAKPAVDDFDTYEDWVEALTDWKADQKIKASKAETENERAEKDFLKRFNEGKKEFKDWNSLDLDFEISKVMQRAIRDTENPAAIVRYLAQNPEEAEEISELPAGRQALRIGRIEAKLEGGNSSNGDKPRRQSSAPTPITPTKTSGKTLSKGYEDMSYGEFIAQRKRDEARASGR